MSPGVKFSELASYEESAKYEKDYEITQLCTDTRVLKKGDTYLAIVGERYDGHDYIEMAVTSGASSLVLSSHTDMDIPFIQVSDTVVALGNIAKIYRNKLAAQVVGITGSNGKTTVKGMVSAICGEYGSVTATVANNNNMIGVPKTLLSASSQNDFLVVEMGTSESGEIAYLVNIVEPDVSVITNISESHLAGLGTRDAVFEEKSAIITGTRKQGAVIVNLDDEYSDQALELAHSDLVMTYGLSGAADVNGTYIESGAGSTVTARTPDEIIEYKLSVPGKHNVSNSLAAVAIARALGIDSQSIIRGLQGYTGVNGRLQVIDLRRNIALIDDSYNANPASAAAALQVLSLRSARRIFVFAGMAELGDMEAELHNAVGIQAIQAKVDALFVVGKITRPTFDVFEGEKYYFDSYEELKTVLIEYLVPGDVLLIKGSRRFGMDRLSKFLAEELG